MGVNLGFPVPIMGSGGQYLCKGVGPKSPGPVGRDRSSLGLGIGDEIPAVWRW